MIKDHTFEIFNFILPDTSCLLLLLIRGPDSAGNADVSSYQQLKRKSYNESILGSTESKIQ